VGVQEEIFAAQQLDCLVAHGIIEKNSAEDRTFGLDVGREAFVEKRITHCSSRHNLNTPVTGDYYG
jgi:hypothetical protein